MVCLKRQKLACPDGHFAAPFDPGIQADSPNGAGFDSPGRQPWEEVGKNQKPQRSAIRRGGTRPTDGESRPLGDASILLNWPTQG